MIGRPDRMKMVVDCDPGVDDAMALMMALAYPELVEVVAITSVFGNGQEEVTHNNILRVLTVCDRLDIPVYRGCRTTMLGELATLDGYFGEDALGDVDDYPADGEAEEEDAVSALCRLVHEYPGELTLVAIGPLTNVAQAIRQDPEFGDKLKDVFIMGGNSDGKGNVTASAEFNFYNDPEAAQFVLDKLGAPITLVPLDTCERYPFNWKWYDRFTSTSTPQAKFLKDIEELTVRRTQEEKGKYHCYDQYACAAALDTTLLKHVKDVYVTVEVDGTLTRGQCVVDWGGKMKMAPNVKLVLGIKKGKLKKMLNTAVGRDAPYCYDHTCEDEVGEDEFV